jgi:hypothetical protein
MKHVLTSAEREKRVTARWKIIQVANNHRMITHANNPYIPKMLGIKNINEAVFCVRQAMLVDGKTLMEAGFKPVVVKAGHSKPTVLKRLLGQK